ncbi:MAG TPA: glyoxalase superfamily protein [Lacipirellulaceae bacterium]
MTLEKITHILRSFDEAKARELYVDFLGFKVDSTMRLDTLHTMTAATRLYESVGFVPRAPYYETPLVHTIFMERG